MYGPDGGTPTHPGPRRPAPSMGSNRTTDESNSSGRTKLSNSPVIEPKSKEVWPALPLTPALEYKGLNGPRDQGHPRGLPDNAEKAPRTEHENRAPTRRRPVDYGPAAPGNGQSPRPDGHISRTHGNWVDMPAAVPRTVPPQPFYRAVKLRQGSYRAGVTAAKSSISRISHAQPAEPNNPATQHLAAAPRTPPSTL